MIFGRLTPTAYGVAAQTSPYSVNEQLTTYQVAGLGSGTWYFAIKACNSTGTESNLSNVASKTIS